MKYFSSSLSLSIYTNPAGFNWLTHSNKQQQQQQKQ
jgi:hypothetical protein